MILGARDALILAACIAVHLAYRYKRWSTYPLPPGLPKWPFVGNALQIPQEQQHRYFKELGKKLGSKIFHLEAFNQHMVVINDVKVAQDLLERRSALYSSRPRTTMLSEIMGIDYIFPFMPYGDEWRNRRRIFQQYFSPKYIEEEQDRVVDFVRKGLLPNLYETPGSFSEHLLNLMGGLTTAMIYGISIRRIKDPLVEFQGYSFEKAQDAAVPGRFLVDIIPLLKYVPEWFPGAGFKTVGKELAAIAAQAMEVPYYLALKGIDDGTTTQCFVSWSLEKISGQSNYDTQALWIKQVAGSIYPAGTDTRAASADTFILAMLLHPEVQRKAQVEIDAVVGHDRLPDFKDRPLLPYLGAVVKEVLRWNPPLPLGVPHLTSTEDVYEGYYIPKDAVVFANSYAMLRDEEIFHDPESFIPERFLTKDGAPRTDILDPESIATFGFGRRVCPGAQIAISTLYLVAASILSLFDIMPEMDSEGKPIQVTPDFACPTIISQPVSFRCRIVPRRSKDVDGLLKDYFGYEVI